MCLYEKQSRKRGKGNVIWEFLPFESISGIISELAVYLFKIIFKSEEKVQFEESVARTPISIFMEV